MHHKARRRFGQNFLSDESVLYNITQCLGLREEDALIEIGPGKGALTGLISSKLTQMWAIEIDRDLVPRLRQKYANVNVIEADVLRFDFSKLFNLSERQWRIVGNLPYNISTPLLDLLLVHADRIKDMHFMLQKEVVQRLCAQPGSKSWGRLSIMMQYHCDVEKMLDVPPQSFTPAPKVDSAFVRLTPKAKTLALKDKQVFKKVVRTAFNQRRKTLRNALKVYLPVLSEVDIDLNVRPEQLSVSEYVHISNHVFMAENN